MALPNRAVAYYVALGKSEDNNPFVNKAESIISDYHGGTGKPGQTEFYSFQHWLKNYPKENLVIIMAPGCGGPGWIEIEMTTCDYDYTYPSDIVYEYDPDPPLSQPAPDPNGDVGTQTGDGGAIGVLNQAFPRWHTDDAYDFEAIPFPGIIPPAGITFIMLEGGGVPQGGYCSYEASVTNLDSEVMNVATGSPEYYPFLQTTTELKVTTKFKIKTHPDNIYSCWNEGTVIKGKVGFKSFDITADPVPSSVTPGYGYEGIEITFGTTSSDAGTADWEVTWEDGFTAAEITIPRTAGKVTFINDIWVTEVIKPA
jgi:hypothetical protein